MKNLHLLGAHDLQILSQGLKVVAPRKKPVYADLAEYKPELESLQLCLSS
jgi:hypothetical protein